MLSESPESGRSESEPRRKEPEYVGAPTEYANAAEVPESVSLLAKVLAGGVLTWIVVVAVLGVLAAGCAICFSSGFLFGLFR
jgi:uncharacterized membrane protein